MSRLLEARPLRRALADAISVLTPKANAGACVPENGSLCYCNCYRLCDPHNCWYTCYKVRVDCYGRCKESSTFC